MLHALTFIGTALMCALPSKTEADQAQRQCQLSTWIGRADREGEVSVRQSPHHENTTRSLCAPKCCAQTQCLDTATVLLVGDIKPSKEMKDDISAPMDDLPGHGGTLDQDGDDEDTTHITTLLNDLEGRAKVLLSELELFKEHLRNIRLESSVETAHYHGQVKSELGMLERLSSQPPVQSSYHIAKSSNLPFLETVWTAAKGQDRLAALQKRFFYPRQAEDKTQHELNMSPLPPRRRRRGGGKAANDASCVVDVVADGGRTWFKVSLISNTRLLFDLAKRGWEIGDSDSDGGRSGRSASSKEEDDDDIVPLVKMARDLAAASKAIKVQTKHPKVVLILPRVAEGETKEIDLIIQDCRAFSVTIICKPHYEPHAHPSLQDALSKMAPFPFAAFTDDLNIDCTILLALVSEFSHAKVSKEAWFHTALQRQVEIEGNENLLPSLLYPAMSSKRLVCTHEAAQRMREIVDTIGTPSEKARTAIMLGEGIAKDKTAQELTAEMQSWSAYAVPAEWRLPIEVIDFDPESDHLKANLPAEAATVCAGMTSINRSIFLYGWASDKTTITSNKTIVKQIDSQFDKLDNVNDAAWPKIWLCPTARSLVGKEKRGAPKKSAVDDENANINANARRSRAKKDGIWPLPDPLRRESQRRNGLDVLSLREGHEVEDLRPHGYDYSDVLQAKQEAQY